MRVVLLSLFLAACVPAPGAPVAVAPDIGSDIGADIGHDTCGAALWQARVGVPVAGFALPVAGPVVGARVIAPGDAITEDYSPSRLNIDVDATGRILRAWCG